MGILTTRYNNAHDNGQTDLTVYCGDKLVATICVYNGYIDYTNEMDRTTYNLLTIENSGQVSNDKPREE